MYIDFDPKKLGDELRENAMGEVDKAVSQLGPRDPLDCWGNGEDGGGGGDVVTQAALIDAHGNAYPEDGGGPDPWCGTTA